MFISKHFTNSDQDLKKTIQRKKNLVHKPKVTVWRKDLFYRRKNLQQIQDPGWQPCALIDRNKKNNKQ